MCRKEYIGMCKSWCVYFSNSDYIGLTLNINVHICTQCPVSNNFQLSCLPDNVFH